MKHTKSMRTLFTSITAILFLSLCLMGCSETKDYPELTLGTSLVRMKLKGDIYQTSPTRSVGIYGGNGVYRVHNPESFSHIAEATIEANTLFITPRMSGQTIQVTVSDQKGQEATLQVIIEEDYVLMTVKEIYLHVKAEDSWKEIIQQTALEECYMRSGEIYEFCQEDKELVVKQYTDKEKMIAGNPEQKGTFQVDALPWNITLDLGNTKQIYEMGDNYIGIIQLLIHTFDITLVPPTENRTRNSAPTFNTNQLLVYDVTETYQERYPEAEIEEVKVGIYTSLSSYKEN